MLEGALRLALSQNTSVSSVEEAVMLEGALRHRGYICRRVANSVEEAVMLEGALRMHNS